MRNLFLTLIALLMANVAMATNYFYIDEGDATVSFSQLDGNIIVPVKAHFEGRLSGFQLDMTYPVGLTPVRVQNGSGMNVNYVNEFGEDAVLAAPLYKNGGYTRFISAIIDCGYWYPDGSNELEKYGVIKWDAGEYDEMFLLTLHVDPSFSGGEILMETTVDSGEDARGGTVKDMGENGQMVPTSCYVAVVPADIPNFEGEICVGEVNENGSVSVVYTGSEEHNMIVVVNGVEVPVNNGMIQLPNYGVFEIEVTIEAIGYNPLIYSCSRTREPLYTPQPVINKNVMDECVEISADGDGEVHLFIDGQEVSNPVQIPRGDEDFTVEVRAVAQMNGWIPAETVIQVLIPAKENEEPVEIENGFIVGDVEVLQGGTVVIPVSMKNAEAVTAFQTDMYLPEGFELVKVELSDRADDHQLLTNNRADGGIRILCYSSSLTSFNGNDGELFYITLNAPEVADVLTDGDMVEYMLYTLNLKKILLTTAACQEIHCSDASGTVKWLSYIKGDANGSGKVTVTDVVVTAQYVLGYDPDPFIFGAADMTEDDEISVTDVVLIARMVLDPRGASLMRAPAVYQNNDVMSGEDINLQPGETRTVTIALDNEVDYTAFQLDMQLPDGMTASNFRLTDRAGSHAIDANMLNNGKQRVMCYSSQLATINGHEGALLTFDVTASDDVVGGIMVDGIEMVSAACETVSLDAFTIQVNNAVTAVKDLAGDLRIYPDGQNIVIETPVAQHVVISDMAGHSYSVDVPEGRTVIPSRLSGVVVVNAGSKTAKIMIK